MRKANFLVTSVLSTFLLTSTISAQHIQCKDGKCFIDISNLTKPKNVESKLNTFKKFKTVHFTSTQDDTIIFEHSKYIMSEDEKNNYIENDTIYNAEGAIVLTHSKYVMTEAEKEEYYRKQRLEQIELEKEILIPSVTIEDKIANEITLPDSELYCDNKKHAKFHPESNEYECV